MTFLQLLRLAADFETWEPRDAVYALLGIRTKDNDPDHAPFLVANYSISEKELNHAVFMRSRDTSYPLSILSSANQIRNPYASEECTSIVPSWLPQWKNKSTAAIICPWSTDAYFTPGKGLEISPMPDVCGDTLNAYGLEVSMVSFRSKIIQQTEYIDADILSDADTSHMTVQNIISLLSRTLTAGRNEYGGIALDQNQFLADCAAAFSSQAKYHGHRIGNLDLELIISTVNNLSSGGDLKRFFTVVHQVCPGRLLFLTTSGHLGLGPKNTVAGDRLCILAGHKMPVILRPCPSGYIFVGDCYVDGIMWGEAVAAFKEGRAHLGPFGQSTAIPSLEYFPIDEDKREIVEAAARGFVEDTLRKARERYEKPRETTFSIV